MDSILEGDCSVWRKQRHSAHRIYGRPLDEAGHDGKYGIAKNHVRRRRAEISTADGCYLELLWGPGEAQADFGDVDVIFCGGRVRMRFFALSFPHSNVGCCQLFAGQTSECVCQGLRDMFEHVGGVPSRIVFDDAAGAGRRRGAKVAEADLFERMKVHYGFEATYADPRSGNEEGNAERKVCWRRRHLFTPEPGIDDMAALNAGLLAACDGAASNRRYERHMAWGELSERDRAAMPALPRKPSSCVRYATGAAVGKRGDVVADGGRRHHVGHGLATRSVTVAYGAHAAAFADASGEVVAEHPRGFGTPCNGPDAASQLALLSLRPGAWRNSAVRAAMPAEAAAHMDSMEAGARRDLLFCMGKWCRNDDIGQVGSAIAEVLAAMGRVKPSDVEMTIARMGGVRPGNGARYRAGSQGV